MVPWNVDDPMRSEGAALSGLANEALMRILLSLTVGSRCRTCPASHDESAGCVPRCAYDSAGRAARIAAPTLPLRNFRRSISTQKQSGPQMNTDRKVFCFICVYPCSSVAIILLSLLEPTP